MLMASRCEPERKKERATKYIPLCVLDSDLCTHTNVSEPPATSVRNRYASRTERAKNLIVILAALCKLHLRSFTNLLPSINWHAESIAALLTIRCR